MQLNISTLPLALLFFLTIGSCKNNLKENHAGSVKTFLHPSVTNADDPEVRKVIALWKNYIEGDQFYTRDHPLWTSDHAHFPDAFLWQLNLPNLASKDREVQHTILGVFPVEYKHYALKIAFQHINDSSGQILLDYAITVYAKKNNDQYFLVNSTDYHRLIWDRIVIGDITYYVHPAHYLKMSEAEQMQRFNDSLANFFECEPIRFDYFVANNSREILDLIGFDFMPRKYLAVQSGGMAANYDNIIYAGNNSAYYPHEVVHLYTYSQFRNQYHQWIDEGIATLLGGSTGHPLKWHLSKLAKFLKENPSYPLNNLDSLAKDIPNGEYTTDFRYVIGGLISQKIYEKEGKSGLFDALQAGRSEEDFFSLLKDKLDITKEDFSQYMHGEMSKYQ